MDIYLAGGINGNCKPLFVEWIKAIEGEIPMDLYLAGIQGKGRGWCMDLYLAGIQGKAKGGVVDEYLLSQTTHRGEISGLYDEILKDVDVAILESFYYADEWTEKIIPYLKRFMLDSGAFTLFGKGEKNVDWDAYIHKYASFINRNGVNLFYELDIDKLIGYDKVLYYRAKLEDLTGKKCIPVWHRSRGYDEFIKICEEYDYVAIGGIAIKDIARTEYKYFPHFINEAHKHGTKIHGLGFTNLKGLEKYKFDSVDSTAWVSGNRFGAIYKFNGHTMIKVDKKEGQRLKDSKAVAINNFNEWVKFQQYAEKYL